MKKINSFLICFLLAATALLPLTTLGGNNLTSAYADGENEITISSVAGLKQIADYVNSGTDNYAGKTITLANDLDLGAWTPIGNASYAFKGTFDGAGHTISNITISDKFAYQGIFGHTNGATIKNLSVADFSSSNLSSEFAVYVGAILGQGQNTKIENCEVDQSATNTFTFEIGYTTYLGSVAGNLTSGSEVSNTSSFMKVNATYNLKNEYTVKVGGFVGSAENTKFEKASSFGGINLTYSGEENPTLSSTFYVGGFAGELSGVSNNIMHDCVVGGEINSQQVTPVEPAVQNMNVGAVAGALVSAQAGGIASVAYISTFDAFKINTASYQTSTNNVMQVPTGAISTQDFYESDTFSFQMNETNQTFAWHKSTGRWDFTDKWVLANGQLRLQLFQYFDVNFADELDPNKQLLEKYQISPEPAQGDQKPYTYNQLVSMTFRFKNSENNKYYDISDILLGTTSLNFGDFTASEDEEKGTVKTSKSGDISFYKIGETYHLDVLANNATDGKYSFKLKAIEYKAYILPDENGSVRYSGTSAPLASIERVMTASSNAITVEAVSNKRYRFNGWSIFYEDETAGNIEYADKIWKQQSISISSANPLQIKFAEGAYNQNFLLMANFAYDPCTLTFEYDPTMITKIAINTENITASSESVDLDKNEPATIKVYVKQGIEFDTEVFEKAIKNNFTRDTLSLKTSTYKDDLDATQTVYEYTFSTSSLNYETSPTFNFTLSTKIVEDEKDPNLTLWIILGSVGGGLVLIGTGLTIWLVIRRKAYGKAGKAKNEDYKNYYY